MPKASETREVYISLGSNQGRRLYFLDDGVQALERIATGPLRCSPVYETRPVGPVPQADYLNMVVGLETSLSARELLRYLLNVEQAAGRERTIRFGPRTLDLDILMYDNEYICFRDLQIPHPRMWSGPSFWCPWLR